MFLRKLLFWNVDTQNDFVLPEGKLAVPGAELLQPVWKEITKLAEEKSIQVINSADFHYPGSAELSTTPDFISTFPSHCMANTTGAEFVSETNPENPLIINWNQPFSKNVNLKKQRNIVIRKDAFDVFSGNQYTESVLQTLAPETVVVYGVTTNVCVNDAVVGLAKRIKQVVVIADAIKELPGIPLPFENWERLGIRSIPLTNLRELIDKQ